MKESLQRSFATVQSALLGLETDVMNERKQGPERDFLMISPRGKSARKSPQVANANYTPPCQYPGAAGVVFSAIASTGRLPAGTVYV